MSHKLSHIVVQITLFYVDSLNFYFFLLSLSIVLVQSQKKKNSCHQNCLILVVQISLIYVIFSPTKLNLENLLRFYFGNRTHGNSLKLVHMLALGRRESVLAI